MNRKIIEPGRIVWDEKEKSRLSYQMLFEQDSGPGEEPEPVLKPEEEAEYLREVLQEQEKKWKQALDDARKEAYQLGVREGEKVGRIKARKELENCVSKLDESLEKAHNEWRETREQLIPGLLDLVFEITEAVLSVPVENPAIRARLEEELSSILQRMDESSRIRLWLNPADLEVIEGRVSDYAPDLPLTVHAEPTLNPGEYRLESDRETVVSAFKTKLKSFRKTLSLPSWSQ